MKNQMDEQLQEIKNVRRHLGDRISLLGHYYIRAELLDLCDQIGDSYGLSVAASRSEAEFIVFCGVRFMAESARILCRPTQRVLLPNRNAGCPLADFVSAEECRKLLEHCAEALPETPTPLLYVNSWAAVKAVCGEYGGICCTSSNAVRLTEELLADGRRVLILPDARIGQNTAAALGLCDDEILMVDADFNGEIDPRVKLLLWNGYCHVHRNFTVNQIEKARRQLPGCRVLVHPECEADVAQAADYAGSTKQLLEQIDAAEEGATLVIGTEYNFVERAARLHPEVHIHPLHQSNCFNFNRINGENLLQTLQSIEQNQPFGEIKLSAELIERCRLPLQRMLDMVESGATNI